MTKRPPQPSRWMGYACTALAALLVALTVALAIALLADHFIFTNGGFKWTWPST